MPAREDVPPSGASSSPPPSAPATAASSDFFVLADAPADLVAHAQAVGRAERRKFNATLAAGEHTADERMHLYATHLLRCSDLDDTAELSNQLDDTVGDAAPFLPDESTRRAQEILQGVGFDKVTTRLFTMPAEKIKTTIGKACLKNELHFQCAFGFVGDREKILEHMAEMKRTDGNVRVMFEREKNDEEEQLDIPRLYSCIGDAAGELRAGCSAAMSVYNKTRETVNSRTQAIYRATLREIDDELEKGMSGEFEATVVRTNEKLKKTLREIRQLESFGCRIFGQDRTRERGDDLHTQFTHFGVNEHQHCSQLT
ncbi:hypothetical protein M3Y99_00796500 [Aphelenchoides fujianensis]|nr:hypothetical protein M3Y99_00796500 [Aphelenchoides fujianensis]